MFPCEFKRLNFSSRLMTARTLSRLIVISFTLTILSTFPPEAHAFGGKDGAGGGDPLAAAPATTKEFMQAISEAKLELSFYIKRRLLDYDDSKASALERKIYGGSPNLLDLIYEKDLEILTDRPCHDDAGNEKGGSIYSSKPDSICLSISRALPFFSSTSVRSGTFGLLMHELSHFLGTSEEEAQALQKTVIAEYDKQTDDERDSGIEPLPTARVLLKRLRDAAEKLDTIAILEPDTLITRHQYGPELNRALTHLTHALDDVIQASHNSRLSALEPVDLAWLKLQRDRIFVAAAYQKSNVDTISLADHLAAKLLFKREWPSRLWKEFLDRLFGSSASLTYGDFRRTANTLYYSMYVASVEPFDGHETLATQGEGDSVRPGPWDDFVLERVRSRDEQIKSFKSVLATLGASTRIIQNITLGHRPPHFSFSPTAFASNLSDYYGVYDVRSVNCAMNSAHRPTAKTIEIYNGQIPSAEGFCLKYHIGDRSSPNLQTLCLADSESLQFKDGANTHQTHGPTWLQWQREEGELWAPHTYRSVFYSSTSLQLEKTPHGQLVLTETEWQRRNYDWRAPEQMDDRQSCRYELAPARFSSPDLKAIH